MLRTLFKKEFRGAWRTYRLPITLAVLLAIGLISPLLAKYTPVILRSVPDMPAALADLIPEPTVGEAVAQYIKNISQFGVLLVIVVTMGIVAGERERGTAVMLLTKPVRPSAVILAKWLSAMLGLLMGLALAAGGCALYTMLLFEPIDAGAFLALNGLLYVFLGVSLTLALLASTLATTQALAAAGAFGLLVVMLILGALPRIGEYMPGELLSWGGTLFMDGGNSGWAALGV
ncbi:MAG: ABC transporter permease subunit, partial [Chloroflexota bacterium]|nr:ABC transporter permease subunit [Chloroflexota bacterium]